MRPATAPPPAPPPRQHEFLLRPDLRMRPAAGRRARRPAALRNVHGAGELSGTDQPPGVGRGGGALNALSSSLPPSLSSHMSLCLVPPLSSLLALLVSALPSIPSSALTPSSSARCRSRPPTRSWCPSSRSSWICPPPRR